MNNTIILAAVNNSPAVRHGFLEPNFTMRLKDLNTIERGIYVESAQFELHYQNVHVGPESNKLFVETSDMETNLRILTGTYTEAESLVKVMSQTPVNANHGGIEVSYVQAKYGEKPRCRLVRLYDSKDSPSLILSILVR